MRISFIPPSEDEFKLLFTSTPLHKGGGIDDISIFQPKQTFLMQRSRRGGGILSFLTRRVLPFIFKAAKPSAKTFVSSVVKDVMEGKTPIKKSIKRHGIKALKDTGLKLISGSGRIQKKKRGKKKGRLITRNTIKKKKRKTKRNQGHRYKKDIFDII